MNSIHYDVWRRGGVAATHELLQDGHTSHALTAAVRASEVIRIRQGHYGCSELSPIEIEAFRVGGRLTGLSGARFHGIWTPPSAMLEVAVHPDARALRSRTDATVRLSTLRNGQVIVDWRDRRQHGSRTVMNVAECLIEIIRSQPAIVAFASVESALYTGAITVRAWQRILTAVPDNKRGYLNEAGKSSESGGESLFKYHQLEENVEVAQQVTVPGVARLDFVLGERLNVEIDGGAFHTGREKFEADRRRDALLTALGYRVLRFSYTQVDEHWPEVAAAVRASIARGDHLA